MTMVAPGVFVTGDTATAARLVRLVGEDPKGLREWEATNGTREAFVMPCAIHCRDDRPENGLVTPRAARGDVRGVAGLAVRHVVDVAELAAGDGTAAVPADQTGRVEFPAERSYLRPGDRLATGRTGRTCGCCRG